MRVTRGNEGGNLAPLRTSWGAGDSAPIFFQVHKPRLWIWNRQVL